MISRLLDFIRGLETASAPTGSEKPARSTRPRRAGHDLYARAIATPAFPLDSATILGSYMGPPAKWGDDPETMLLPMDRAYDLLERIEIAHKACAGHIGNPSLNPVDVSFAAMDWAEITHKAADVPDLKVSIPTILDGKWIGRDPLRLLDIASTIVVHATLAPIEGQERVHVLMEKLRLVATGLYTAHLRSDHDSGFHINLPSPFGPGEIRQHDISGSPYVAYDLPDAADFQDLPHAYQVECQGYRLHVTRARIFNDSPVDLSGIDRDDQRRLLAALARFDPNPKPGYPRSSRSRECYGIVRGRTILTVRRQGSDLFELPGFIVEDDTDWTQARARIERSLGVEVTPDAPYDYIPGALEIGGYDGVLDLYHSIRRYHLKDQPEPTPHDDVVELHWLNFDTPDRPVSEIMEHLILRNARARIPNPYVSTGTVA